MKFIDVSYDYDIATHFWLSNQIKKKKIIKIVKNSRNFCKPYIWVRYIIFRKICHSCVGYSKEYFQKKFNMTMVNWSYRPNVKVLRYGRGLPFAGDGRIPGHGLRRNFKIRIGPVQKRLPALRQVLKHQTGRRRRAPAVQWRSARTRAGSIFHIKTANKIQRSRMNIVTREPWDFFSFRKFTVSH